MRQYYYDKAVTARKEGKPEVSKAWFRAYALHRACMYDSANNQAVDAIELDMAEACPQEIEGSDQRHLQLEF